jgi:hypothetical protein
MNKRIHQELVDYNLKDNTEYWKHFSAYQSAILRRNKVKDTPTKNMIKALRMMPYANTVEDWARLHSHEIYCKRK